MKIRWEKLIQWEPVIGAALLLLLLDHWIHRFPEMRGAFDFRPEAAGGNINEYFTIWIARFSHELRKLPFEETLYMLNPWGAHVNPDGTRSIAVFTSHPPLLSFAVALLQGIFGESALVLRRFAMLIFCVNTAIFWALGRRLGGASVGRLSALFHLAAVGTIQLSTALLCEPAALTLSLLCYLLISRCRYAWLPVAAAALLTDWTAVFWLPFLLLPLLKERRFSEAMLLSCTVVLLPTIYNRLLVGFYRDGAFIVSRFPALHIGFGEVTGLDPVIFRLKQYLSGIMTHHTFVPKEEYAAILDRFFLASPVFVLIPAVLGVVYAVKQGAVLKQYWLVSCLAGGAAFFCVFSGGFIVHTYMFLPFSLATSWFAANGILAVWRKGIIQGGISQRVVAGAVLAATTLAGVQGFRLPVSMSAEVARGIGEFHAEANILNKLIAGTTAYAVKDYSQWEPNPFLIDARDVRFVFSPRRKGSDGREHCADYNVIFSGVFQESYGHFPLDQHVSDHIARTETCARTVWVGRFFRVVPGTCMCDFGG